MPIAMCDICLIWCLPCVYREITVSVWSSLILGSGWAVWKQSGEKELEQAVRAPLVPVPSESLKVCVTKEGLPGVPPKPALHQGCDVQ